MEWTREKLEKANVRFETVQEFATRHEVTTQAIYHARASGSLDYMRLGGSIVIVLAGKSLKYKPNAHANVGRRRSIMET
jgi:hypothetical protein